MTAPEGMPHRERPCVRCPVVTTTSPGEFPVSRYEEMRRTSEAPTDPEEILVALLGHQSLFACHKSSETNTVACAGWLASPLSDGNLTVREAVRTGDLPACALRPGPDWPPLFQTYDDMITTMGRPDHLTARERTTHPMTEKPTTTIHAADDVTDEILDVVREVIEGWYNEGRIDWPDVWDRAEGAELADGSILDLGTDLVAPALVKIQRIIRAER